MWTPVKFSKYQWVKQPIIMINYVTEVISSFIEFFGSNLIEWCSTREKLIL